MTKEFEVLNKRLEEMEETLDRMFITIPLEEKATCIICNERAFPVWIYHNMPYCTTHYKKVRGRRKDLSNDPFLQAMREL